MTWNIFCVLLCLGSLAWLWRFAVFTKTFTGLTPMNVAKVSFSMLSLILYFLMFLVAYLIMFITTLTSYTAFVKTVIVFLHFAVSSIFGVYILKNLFGKKKNLEKK